MNKPSQTMHREVKADARRAKPPRGAVNVRSGPPKLTATLKRRALRKKPGKPAGDVQSRSIERLSSLVT
jgi:hypothetical protein